MHKFDRDGGLHRERERRDRQTLFIIGAVCLVVVSACVVYLTGGGQ
jgi:hypothetical protein